MKRDSVSESCGTYMPPYIWHIKQIGVHMFKSSVCRATVNSFHCAVNNNKVQTVAMRLTQRARLQVAVQLWHISSSEVQPQLPQK